MYFDKIMDLLSLVFVLALVFVFVNLRRKINKVKKTVKESLEKTVKESLEKTVKESLEKTLKEVYLHFDPNRIFILNVYDEPFFYSRSHIENFEDHIGVYDDKNKGKAPKIIKEILETKGVDRVEIIDGHRFELKIDDLVVDDEQKEKIVKRVKDVVFVDRASNLS